MTDRLQRFKSSTFKVLAIVLSLFILAEVNYPRLAPQSQLAIFAMLGLILIFLKYPIHKNIKANLWIQRLDITLILITAICFGYIFIQSEPLFKSFWIDNQQLGNRAGMEQTLDYFIGFLGLVLVLEATRRAIGITLPLVSFVFIVYAAFGSALPDWMFPHRGYSWERIVSQTFLHSQGVFGIASKVMFTYVYLFVLFGTFLEATGATGFIIQFTRNLFRKSVGGPAKVAVISSGMMGSLSGSAVANTATTGTFTIPMMKSSGFKPATAAGVEAAASSGGALMPPIMGAGAYMMLEIIEPAVTYLQIIKAAIIPALLYYTALLLIVHFQAKKIGSSSDADDQNSIKPTHPFKGILFFTAFFTLIAFLVMGYSPFRAVSLSLLVILVLSVFHKETRMGLRGIFTAMENGAHGGISLIAAASCVGIILGVVTLTGIGTKLPGTILPLAQDSLTLALFLLMISTIILGMGLPSVVCYLLMATLVGPILSDLGIIPLAAHLFIFYFGLMSMVTPPVALAAYTAAAIAGSRIMPSGYAAFRFALIGFALPYAFVLRPELLLFSADGSAAGFEAVFINVFISLLAIIALAAALSGYWLTKLSLWMRALLLTAAMVLLLTQSGGNLIWLQLAGFAVFTGIGFLNWREKVAA